MSEKMMENNRVQVMGEIVSRLSYSHEIYGAVLYDGHLSVPHQRDEGLHTDHGLGEADGCHRGPYRKADMRRGAVPLLQPPRGEEEPAGALRIREGGRLCGWDRDGRRGETNQVFLDGYICKEPTYRKTPLGREIADVLLAVNRPYGKSDYIPCICWGRNARLASRLNVGDEVMVAGRIQSRGYMKKLSETEAEERVAYEVSVSMMETVGCAGE